MKQQVFSRDFTLVVIGQIISLFGNAILHFALPLYLLRETGSSALFGVVTACSFLPMVILSPIGGAVADRVNKRSMMAGLDFFTAGLILMYALVRGLAPLVPVTVACLMLLYAVTVVRKARRQHASSGTSPRVAPPSPLPGISDNFTPIRRKIFCENIRFFRIDIIRAKC